jgi:hypothetical protein
MIAFPLEPVGASCAEASLHDTEEDILEVPLLLQSSDVRALIEAARQQGTTAASLARRLIGDYLRKPRTA